MEYAAEIPAKAPETIAGEIRECHTHFVLKNESKNRGGGGIEEHNPETSYRPETWRLTVFFQRVDGESIQHLDSAPRRSAFCNSFPLFSYADATFPLQRCSSSRKLEIMGLSFSITLKLFLRAFCYMYSQRKGNSQC